MRPDGVADRRDFLKVTGVLTGCLAVGSPLALLAPSRAWALELAALNSERMARVIAPKALGAWLLHEKSHGARPVPRGAGGNRVLSMQDDRQSVSG